MDKNLHNDPLEEFFRKHLNEDDTQLPEEEGWDVPSDGVWKGVAAGIPEVEQPKRRIIPYWRWISVAAAAILLLLIFQLQQYEQTVEHLTEELQTNQEELQDVKTQLEITEKNLVEETKERLNHTRNQQRKEGQEVASEDRISSGVISSPKVNEEKSAVRSIDQNNVNVLFQKDDVIVATPEIQNTESVNSKTSVPREQLYFSELEQRLSFATIENIPTIQLMTPQLNQKLDLYLQMGNGFGGNDIDDILPKTSGFYVGANVAPSHGFRKLETNGSNSRFEKLNKKETAQFTIGGGLKLGYQLNDKWSIETGVQLAKSKISTEHRLEKQYTSDNEMSNSIGELEKNYVLVLTTSYGDVVDDVAMSRPTNIMVPENLPFDLRIESEQYLTTIGIPLIAKYQIGKQRTKLSLKGGVMSNFVADTGMKVKPIRRPLPFFKPQDRKFDNKKLKLKGQKSLTLDWMIGAEAEFKLSKFTYFSLEPSFSKSVTPLFEKEDVKTYPAMASVKIGVNHYF